MANITKRKTGYRIRVYCGDGAGGKQIVKSKTWTPPEGMTPKQAEKEVKKVAEEFEARMRGGDFTAMQNITLSEFCDEYLEMSREKLGAVTHDTYSRVINRLIKPCLGHMKLNEIKPLHAQQFIKLLSSKGTRVDGKGTQIAPATVKRYFTVLKSVMAKAYKLDLIEKNPTESAKLDFPEIDEPEVQIMDRDETAHMLACLEGEPLELRLLVHVAVVTGMRRGEIAALQWKAIDFDKNTVTVSQSNYKVKGREIETKATKTRRVRKIIIPEYLTDMFRQYRREQNRYKITLGDAWHEGGWVFTQADGKPVNPTSPTRMFDLFLKRHGIPHIKFHALRHTSATLLLSSGINIKNVASRLGHTQLSTTSRYVHALKEIDGEAADIFEGIALGEKKEDGAKSG